MTLDANSTAVVKITAAEGKRAKGGANVLMVGCTSGAGGSPRTARPTVSFRRQDGGFPS